MAMAKKRELPGLVKFRVGDRVRVKQGIRDADYPDMPLGGWAGTITEVHDHGMYTVRWSQETLAAIHPVFEKRCRRDGMDLGQYRLKEDDLETDAGGPLAIEHPAKIHTKALSPKNEDDRVRMVFDLTSDDPLPDVDYETVETYREYLAKNLVFPFGAKYIAETGPFSSKAMNVQVIGLGDADDQSMIDDMYGIMCYAQHERRKVILPLGELEVPERKPNRPLIEDYAYWFWNNR